MVNSFYQFQLFAGQHISGHRAQHPSPISLWPLIFLFSTSAAAAAKSLQSCLTLSDPMDCNPPGSSVHGIFQARVLEWGAIASQRGPQIIFKAQGYFYSISFSSPKAEWQNPYYPVLLAFIFISPVFYFCFC